MGWGCEACSGCERCGGIKVPGLFADENPDRERCSCPVWLPDYDLRGPHLNCLNCQDRGCVHCEQWACARCRDEGCLRCRPCPQCGGVGSLGPYAEQHPELPWCTCELAQERRRDRLLPIGEPSQLRRRYDRMPWGRSRAAEEGMSPYGGSRHVQRILSRTLVHGPGYGSRTPIGATPEQMERQRFGTQSSPRATTLGEQEAVERPRSSSEFPPR